MPKALKTRAAIEAVWRIESARLLGGLVRLVRDVDLAEDLAQETLMVALQKWPEAGIPDNPGAWLMTTAKNRALDSIRRSRMLDRKHDELAIDAPQLSEGRDDADGVGDDLLRLILVACHPVLSKEARVALTLRLLGGLTTEERSLAPFSCPNRPSRSASSGPSGRSPERVSPSISRKGKSSRSGCRPCSRSAIWSSTKAT